VIRLQDDDERRRCRIEPPSDRILVGWCEGIEKRNLAARLHDGRRDGRRPVEARPPRGLVEAPDPEARHAGICAVSDTCTVTVY
jgi:hypothetical protein